jgi:phage baseplate assembly protein gpV
MIISNSFTPFFGFVEDVKDPEKIGRVKVRVTGYHSENKGVLPTDDLYWFVCLVNNSEGDSGIGTNPKYNVGSLVFGYFIDNELQNGFVAGAFNGQDDINKLAANTDIDSTIVKTKKDSVQSGISKAGGGSWSEPQTPYKAVYPENKVTESNSGHVIELDDTEGAERLHVYHRAGTFYEVHPNGSQVVRIVKDGYTIIAGDGYFYIDGESNGFIGGNHDLNIKGNSTINIDKANDITIGNSQNIDIGGSQTVNISTSQTVSVGGAVQIDASSISMNAGTISLTGQLVFAGNVTHTGSLVTSGALSASTIDSGSTSLDQHVHNYTWTDPSGAGTTTPPV